MTILIVLIPLGLLLLAIAIAAFVWAVRHDQFEDLEAEGSRILFEDGPPIDPHKTPGARPEIDRIHE
jgi:cbb3-type cytochrome oxidase maturation protein